MKRYFYREAAKVQAAVALFGRQEQFDPDNYRKYQELEVVQQDDGRFSVWGNLPDDSELLQDTRRDSERLIPSIQSLANEVREEE